MRYVSFVRHNVNRISHILSYNLETSIIADEWIT